VGHVPIANSTPGWELTAISLGPELREGAADDAALLIALIGIRERESRRAEDLERRSTLRATC
jgi:hypothetical protein